jgi:hypothetical protein
VTGLLAGLSRDCGLVSGRDMKLLPFVRRPDRLLSPPSLIFNWYWGLSPEDKRGRGVKLTIYLNVLLRLRVTSAILPLPLWRAQCQYYFGYLYLGPKNK